MPELTVATVEEHTQGRLDRDDPMTATLLARGLAAARRWCGWHVSPVVTDDVVTIDGPGSQLLVLPTLNLGTLQEISEDGVTVPVVDLHVSRGGLLRKKSGMWWTSNYGGITAKMTHGFEDAPDFDAAVLGLIDRLAMLPSGGQLIGVGPFRYSEDKPSGLFTAGERELLSQFRLELPA